MQDLSAILTFVVQAVWGVWPAFLLSVLVGVLVRALKLDGVIRRAFSANILIAILLATAVGAFSPFCSCTVIPVVNGLLLAGVPLAPIMAFWVASPTMDPEIFALSVATLGWPLALARLSATLGLSLLTGYGTLALTRLGWLQGPLLRRATPEPCSATVGAAACAPAIPAPASHPLPLPVLAVASTPAPALAGATSGGACSTTNCTPAPAAPTFAWRESGALLRTLNGRALAQDVLGQSWNLGRWLLLAFVLEALITRYVPQAAIAGVLGTQNPLAVPLAALIGIPLYLNNVSALPIVAGLLGQGMQPGAAIAFLIAGPVTTIPAMTAVWGVVERRVFVLYIGLGLGGSILAGLVTNLLLA